MTLLDSLFAKLEAFLSPKTAAKTPTVPQPTTPGQPAPAPVDTSSGDLAPLQPIAPIAPIAPIDTTTTPPPADSIVPISPVTVSQPSQPAPAPAPTPAPAPVIQPIEISPVTPTQPTPAPAPAQISTPSAPPTYNGAYLIDADNGEQAPVQYTNPFMVRIADYTTGFGKIQGGTTNPPETGSKYWYGNYDAGALVVTAIPNAGYAFDHWEWFIDTHGTVTTSTQNPVQSIQWNWCLRPVFRKL